jgi:hypothetical protein
MSRFFEDPELGKRRVQNPLFLGLRFLAGGRGLVGRLR